MWRCADAFPLLMHGGFGGLFGVLLWAGLLAGLIFLGLRLVRGQNPRNLARTDREDALGILKRRLAEGRISPEEYARLKDVLTD